MGGWPRFAAAIGIAVGYGVLHRLGRTYGSTAGERAAVLPGDDLVTDPNMVCTHAITIGTDADRIWPWLIQMGWHRGGWYTARWVDRWLFPANLASADEIIPELQKLEVGDFIPDGPPQAQCGFTVQQLRTHRHLVLRSNSHLPLSWRTHHRARLDWTWAFDLRPLHGRAGTRLVFRWRARAEPWWFRAFGRAVIVPADFIMSRDMMNGIKARAHDSTSGSR